MRMTPEPGVRPWVYLFLFLPLGVGLSALFVSHFRRDAGLRKEVDQLRAQLESAESKVPEQADLALQKLDIQRLESLSWRQQEFTHTLENTAAAFVVCSNSLAARIAELENENAALIAANVETHQRYSGSAQKIQLLEEEVQRLKNDFTGKPRVPRIGAWVGVTIHNAKDADPEAPNGVLIRDIVSRSPAEFAGLQVGDVVVSIDGRSVSTADEFKGIFAQMAGGQSVALDVQRTNGMFRIPLRATDWPQ